MEGMVAYRRLGDSGDVVRGKTLGDLKDFGDLQLEEICWNWNYCCRFTWQVLKSLWKHTSHREGGLFGGHPVGGMIYGASGVCTRWMRRHGSVW